MFRDSYRPGDYPDDPGDTLAGRIMAAEYNLAVQHPNSQFWQQQAGYTFGRMLGQWLADRFGQSA